MTAQQTLVHELLDQFPKTPSLTLARMAYKKSPALFRDVEKARTAVRRARGNSGERDRAGVSNKKHFRPNGKPGDPFKAIPDGLTHFEDWGAVVIPGPMRVLILSDLHIPYHDKTAILTALKWGRETGVDTVLLNGDTADFFSASFWEKDPRKRLMVAEIDMCKQFFSTLREGFPHARIIAKQGNHEERWGRYMSVKAPELLGVPEFEAQEILGLKRHGIEWIAEKRPVRLGHLNVIHGHEHNFAISNPVNPARGFFLRSKAHCLGGHFHQTSQHAEKNLEEKVVATWSTGCLCDLHPDYRPINAWNHGFAFVEVFNDGTFNVKNMTIIGGTVH